MSSLATEIREGRLAEYVQITTLDRQQQQAMLRAAENLDHEIAQARSAFDTLAPLVAKHGYPRASTTMQFFSSIRAGDFGDIAWVSVGRIELLLTQAHRSLAELADFRKRFKDTKPTG